MSVGHFMLIGELITLLCSVFYEMLQAILLFAYTWNTSENLIS